MAPLNQQTESEFSRGAGNEIGTAGNPGPMASLRSSSALAVNVFDPWRERYVADLARAIDADPLAERVRFEVTYPTGLRGIPPHLDVVVDGGPGRPTAIESKFTEPYGEATNEFRPSYFSKPAIWDHLELTLSLAKAIDSGSMSFRYLGAAQLIKHTLGLSREYGASGFRLLYLWFDWPSEIADTHRWEIDRFAEAVDADFEFGAMTYQDLFRRLQSVPEPQAGYLDYLGDRYFFDVPR